MQKFRNVELIKPGYETSTKNSKLVNITLFSELGVGGAEGKKFSAELESYYLRLKSNNFVLKEYSYDDDHEKNSLVERLNDICQSYALLRKKGYLVPLTTRYFVNETEKKIFLLMNDMTQGGKKRIWGWSNDMTSTQYLELQNMNLSEDDVKLIQDMVAKLSARAAEEKIRFYPYYYHILQDIESKELEICLLDVDEFGFIDFRHTNYKVDNDQTAKSFYRNFLEALRNLKFQDALSAFRNSQFDKALVELDKMDQINVK